MSNTYIKDNLIIEFDTNDINLTDLSLISRRKWNNTKIKSLDLLDYGLNQYDVGLSTDLKNSKYLNNPYLKLERIGQPSLVDNTIDYSNFGLNVQQMPSIGNVLFSNGGYLINPFKYHSYDIEYMPRYFNNGFTFETTLFVDDSTFSGITNNSNIFLYLGTRAEDKFATSYSGNSVYITSESATLDDSYKIYDVSELKENTQNISTINTYLASKDLYIKNNGQIDFYVEDLVIDDFKLIYNTILLIKDTNYTYDSKNKTITLIDIDVNVSDILNLNYYKIYDDINLVNTDLNSIDNVKNDNEFGLENNVIAFKFDYFGRIGYRKIDESRNIEENYSEEQAVFNGWNHIIITFKPEETKDEYVNIDDECLLTDPRKGQLSIYVNGQLFYRKDDFVEPLYNPYLIDRSKQIGVPYNISWGGGSVGLKNSYNFNGIDVNKPYSLNQLNESLLIEENFNGYFKGGFNKLRIYDKYFTLTDVKTNYKFESEYYNIYYNRGGRIIYTNNYSPIIDIQ